ncbi:hypothetical protein [Vibrio maerlii]|uniref:hypothetical protein n=1 Tax=Vibrio maerlii TaxID=2231648 RepID=UPI000E3D8E5F|nr:hypothetical protein [Vibrio maerlii]
MNIKATYLKLRRRAIKRYIKITQPKYLRYKADYWPDIYKENDTFFFKQYALKINQLSTLSYQNENINIIGSGPSVKNLDYKKFTGQNIFLNGAISLAYEHSLRIDALIIMDANFVYNRFDLIKRLKEKTKLILSLGALCAIAERDLKLIQGHDIYLFNQTAFDKNNKFSQNIDQHVVDGGTVMAIAIQIFSANLRHNMYLLGLDISNANEPRFYESQDRQEKSGLQKDYEDKILPFMTEASIQVKGNIFNCSPVSKLPFTIIPYSDIYE